MPTIWLYREIIIIPATATDLMNSLYTCIGPEVDGEIHTFGVPLSADGMEPATHRGMFTSATQEMHDLITEHLAQEETAAIRHVMDAATETLQEVTNSEAEPGQPWTWPQALEDAGLQTIQTEGI